MGDQQKKGREENNEGLQSVAVWTNNQSLGWWLCWCNKSPSLDTHLVSAANLHHMESHTFLHKLFPSLFHTIFFVESFNSQDINVLPLPLLKLIQ